MYHPFSSLSHRQTRSPSPERTRGGFSNLSNQQYDSSRNFFDSDSRIPLLSDYPTSESHHVYDDRRREFPSEEPQVKENVKNYSEIIHNLISKCQPLPSSSASRERGQERIPSSSRPFSRDPDEEHRARLYQQALEAKRLLGLDNPSSCGSSSGLSAIRQYSEGFSEDDYTGRIAQSSCPKPSEFLISAQESPRGKRECNIIPGLDLADFHDEDEFLYGKESEDVKADSIKSTKASADLPHHVPYQDRIETSRRKSSFSDRQPPEPPDPLESLLKQLPVEKQKLSASEMVTLRAILSKAVSEKEEKVSNTSYAPRIDQPATSGSYDRLDMHHSSLGRIKSPDASYSPVHERPITGNLDRYDKHYSPFEREDSSHSWSSRERKELPSYESRHVQEKLRTEYSPHHTSYSVSPSTSRHADRSLSPLRSRKRTRSPTPPHSSFTERSPSPQRFCRSPHRLGQSPQRFDRSSQRFDRSPQRFDRSPQRFDRSPLRLERSPGRLGHSPHKHERSLSPPPLSLPKSRHYQPRSPDVLDRKIHKLQDYTKSEFHPPEERLVEPVSESDLSKEGLIKKCFLLLERKRSLKEEVEVLDKELARLGKIQKLILRSLHKDAHRHPLFIESSSLYEEVKKRKFDACNQLEAVGKRVLEFPAWARKEAVEQMKSPKSPDKEDDLSEIKFVYQDPGDHWCSLCDASFKTIEDLLNHFQTPEHQNVVPESEKPWLNSNEVDSLKDTSNPNAEKKDLKGLEYMHPVPESYYCNLCKVITGDKDLTLKHLHTRKHNQAYTEFVLLNAFYERRYKLQRDLAMAAKKKETSEEEPRKGSEKRHSESGSRDDSEKRDSKDRDSSSSSSKHERKSSRDSEVSRRDRRPSPDSYRREDSHRKDDAYRKEDSYRKDDSYRRDDGYRREDSYRKDRKIDDEEHRSRSSQKSSSRSERTRDRSPLEKKRSPVRSESDKLKKEIDEEKRKKINSMLIVGKQPGFKMSFKKKESGVKTVASHQAFSEGAKQKDDIETKPTTMTAEDINMMDIPIPKKLPFSKKSTDKTSTSPTASATKTTIVEQAASNPVTKVTSTESRQSSSYKSSPLTTSQTPSIAIPQQASQSAYQGSYSQGSYSQQSQWSQSVTSGYYQQPSSVYGQMYGAAGYPQVPPPGYPPHLYSQQYGQPPVPGLQSSWPSWPSYPDSRGSAASYLGYQSAHMQSSMMSSSDNSSQTGHWPYPYQNYAIIAANISAQVPKRTLISVPAVPGTDTTVIHLGSQTTSTQIKPKQVDKGSSSSSEKLNPQITKKSPPSAKKLDLGPSKQSSETVASALPVKDKNLEVSEKSSEIEIKSEDVKTCLQVPGVAETKHSHVWKIPSNWSISKLKQVFNKKEATPSVFLKRNITTWISVMKDEDVASAPSFVSCTKWLKQRKILRGAEKDGKDHLTAFAIGRTLEETEHLWKLEEGGMSKDETPEVAGEQMAAVADTKISDQEKEATEENSETSVTSAAAQPEPDVEATKENT